MGIRGWVSNSSEGVNIHAEGEQLEEFYRRLLHEAPPLARITLAECRPVTCAGYRDFAIVESEETGQADVLVSPDIATCQDCLAEIFNPRERRYLYPFTNCTNCGPRYSIIRGLPYDRGKTTMAAFPMCADCAAEYCDPRDRRFHAQPIACPTCGPRVQLVDRTGKVLPGVGVDELEAGAIVAVKGLGGFHLACNARNIDAIRRLRISKERGAKPFALMAGSVAAARKEVLISALEEELLCSPAAPIVIMARRTDVVQPLPEELAPGLHTLGIMLPYTPLHHLLLKGRYDFLVLTSANLSGRPLIYRTEEALSQLQGIADYFLLHDREIYHPCDDSVVQVIAGQPVFFRRARGYVPLPIIAPQRFKCSLLAVGGELKNAFCLAAGERAFLSQYLGDMEGYENFLRFRQEMETLQQVVNISPQAIVHDAHPDYQTTRYAAGTTWTKVSVQHHHAHLVSVLGENCRTSTALGVICDGTGYGADGRIWGFEFLRGNAAAYTRVGHLEYLPLPSGDAGAKYPLRVAYAYARHLLPQDAWARTGELWRGLSPAEQQVLEAQLAGNIRVFWTSSAGRLFDAVSALLGVCTAVTYEGQAAIELESAAWHRSRQKGVWEGKAYPVELVNSAHADASPEVLQIRVQPLLLALIDDILSHRDRGEIAWRFHWSIAQAIAAAVRRLGAKGEPIVLNGGVFQNKLLTEMLLPLLTADGWEVLRARALPPGDGGIAFGQALIGNEVLQRCV